MAAITAIITGITDMASTTDDEDLILKRDKIKDASDYKQHRRIKAILDARDRVLDQRRRGMDFLYEGEINQMTFETIVRNAVEDYLIESEFKVRQSKWAQWYWDGHPPTTDGAMPWIGLMPVEDPEEEEDEAEHRLPTRTEMAASFNRFEQVPLEPEQGYVAEAVLELFVEVERERQEDDETHESGDDQEERREAVTNMVLNPGSREPPFGCEFNELGRLQMPEIERQIVFLGLESFMDADDPIVREVKKKTKHPLKREEKTEKRVKYQIPEDVSMEAYRILNDFWSRAGMDIEYDRGLPIERDFDMSGPDPDSELEYGHTDGSPDI